MDNGSEVRGAGVRFIAVLVRVSACRKQSICLILSVPRGLVQALGAPPMEEAKES